MDTQEKTPQQHVASYFSTPGKFEGEPALTSWLYDRMMNGDGKLLAGFNDAGGGHSATMFTMDSEECKAFNLSPRARPVLVETSDGFCYVCETVTEYRRNWC